MPPQRAYYTRGERRASVRTSLYVDDMTVFMAPIKRDIDRLSQILHCFGEVTGLATNFQKSSVLPIRCGNISLAPVLRNLPAKRPSFPMRYLGLPLSVWQLEKRDFQFLEDKVAAKLTPWDGGNITAIGSTTLVKS